MVSDALVPLQICGRPVAVWSCPCCSHLETAISPAGHNSTYSRSSGGSARRKGSSLLPPLDALKSDFLWKVRALITPDIGWHVTPGNIVSRLLGDIDFLLPIPPQKTAAAIISQTGSIITLLHSDALFSSETHFGMKLSCAREARSRAVRCGARRCDGARLGSGFLGRGTVFGRGQYPLRGFKHCTDSVRFLRHQWKLHTRRSSCFASPTRRFTAVRVRLSFHLFQKFKIATWCSAEANN